MSWRTVHELIVADAFHSKKSYQHYLFMNSKHHKRDAFLVAIQLLVVKKMEYACEHEQNVQSIWLLKEWHKNAFNFQQLLFSLNINNHRCKIVEQNNCSDMANCSWTYSSRCVSLQEELISTTCSWTASITKEMLS